MFCSLSKYLLFSDLFWTPAAQAEIRVWTVNNRAGGIFFQPNGVLAWNHQWVFLSTTQQYVNQSLKAQYATQSAPMWLLIISSIHAF